MEEFALQEDPQGDVRFAFELEQMHTAPGRYVDPLTVQRDTMMFLTGLANMVSLTADRNIRLILQCISQAGSFRLALLVAISRAFPSLMDRDADEVGQELVELFDLHTPWLRVVPVDNPAELKVLLDPLDSAHLAEVARRDEVCPLDTWADSKRTSQNSALVDADLWRLWLFGPEVDDRRRLAAALVEQVHPVCIRVLIRPTSLTAYEIQELELLVKTVQPLASGLSHYRSALKSVATVLGALPLFEARCLVASPQPLDPALLSSIGCAVSEPSRKSTVFGDRLEGGFAVLAGPIDSDEKASQHAFRELSFDQLLPSHSPDVLRRIRSVFTTWEMASLFNLPAAKPRPKHDSGWQASQSPDAYYARELALVGDPGPGKHELVDAICRACPSIQPIQALAVVNGLPGSSPFGLELQQLDVENIRGAVQPYGLTVQWSA